MPVVRGGGGDGINVFVFQKFSDIRRRFDRLMAIPKASGFAFQHGLVNVAEGSDSARREVFKIL